MSQFIVNSSETVAVRKSLVSSIEITEVEIEDNTTYALIMRTSNRSANPKFETDTSLVGIQAKATTVLAALEA